ncbi:MAG: LapA family protein [Candidatus Zapsychrus exili]|nr:LapA family protein [Candidatus Zapsychrus exili]
MKNKKIALLVGGVILAIVLLQNTQVVSLRFLFWKLSMPGIILLPLIMIVGFVTGLFVAKNCFSK